MKVFRVNRLSAYGRFRSLRRRYIPKMIATAATIVTGTR
jgi:hypothetical protein